MITRDIAGAFVVPAFDPKEFKSCDTAPSYSCGYNPTVCGTAGSTGGTGFNGRIIDRQALPTQFNNCLVIARGFGELAASSTGQVGSFRQNFMSLAVGLDHNCSTGAGWAAYATECWPAAKPGYLHLRSTASTWNQYLGTATDTGNALCTSTGFVLLSAVGAFDLTGAKRFIRCVVIPELHSSGCGALMPVTADIVFGGAVEQPVRLMAADDVLIVTSACSTST